MTTKQSTLLRLPTLLTAGVLSTGLLVSGCSNNDNVDTDDANATSEIENTAAIEDTATVAKTSEDDLTTSVETVDSDNDVKSEQIATNTEDKTTIDSDNVNPVTASAKQKSLVTNPTEAGTPEDAVKQALDSLYDGDIKQAASYYKVDMANFEEELANTQSAFQQTVDGVTITDTKYNNDKTRATITGELMLKDQSEPAPLTYELQKIDGQWKILG
ncbi:DUF4878 domain-containing protein [uncultured Psychrobacter sp.]|uniref:DUF4878 domain-containing protein n=1 Tax=uncultured Psychrobacter sp. TaxID=259303 RepID=UPI002606DBC3|nr:DUF4878 domain-containing protein [uncultured Psychrobacter sp.]